MNWDTVVTPLFCQRLCLALLHSLWLIGLLAIAGRVIAFLLRKRSVEVQYALYVVLLFGCLVTLPLTFVMVDVTSVVPARGLPGSSLQALPDENGDALRWPTAGGEVGNVINPETAYAASPSANALRTTQSAAQDAAHWTDNWPQAWYRWSPLLMGLYVAGLLAMLARLVTGVWKANRLRLRAETIHDGPLVDLLHTAAARWSMRVVPKLARAGEIVVPVVVGLVRPTILLPMSATTSLSLDELEMILAHELAHVRRYDLWINLMQRLAETVLFFNPAVWHISSRVGMLREYCCDEMVCRTMNTTPAEPRPRYASALLRVVELAQKSDEPTTGDQTHVELATLAAVGKSPSELRRRVARLFGEPLREPLSLSRGGVVTLVALLLALLVGPATWLSPAQSEDQAVETKPAAESNNPALPSGGWGSVTGQFIHEGKVPEGEGDALVVDRESKGIANIFVYLSKATKIHPDLTKSRDAVIAFECQGPHFSPRSLFVRTDQAILIKNPSDRPRNVHPFPRRNESFNWLLAPRDRTGNMLRLTRPENEPFKVGSDFDVQAAAYWLVLDHPYAAVTDKTGRFHIDKLPAGDHEFQVWHEKVGFIAKNYRVRVERDQSTEIAPATVGLARFVPLLPSGSSILEGICHDGDDEPIAGAEVSLYFYDYDADTIERLGKSRSDDEGQFRIRPNSKIDLTAQHPKLYYLAASATERGSVIRLVSKQLGAPRRIKLLMPPAAIVRGRLTDSKGEPIARAKVWSAGIGWGPMRGLTSATTDILGRFEISDLWRRDGEKQPQSGSLKVWHPAFGRRRVRYTSAPEIGAIVLPPPAVIEGRVVHGQGNEPLPSVWVQAQNINRRSIGTMRVRTDEEGRYRLLLPESAYNVWAQQVGWTVKALDSFEAKAGETRQAPDLKLIKGGFVSGRLVDSGSGEPATLLEGDRVHIGLHGPSRPRSGAAVESTQVESDGTFRIRVAPGSNYVYVMGPGPFEIVGPQLARSRSRKIAHEIEVKEGMTLSIEFQVRRLGTSSQSTAQQKVGKQNIGAKEIRDEEFVYRFKQFKSDVAASIVRELYRDLLTASGRTDKNHQNLSVALEAKINAIRIKSHSAQLRQAIFNMLRTFDRLPVVSRVDINRQRVTINRGGADEYEVGMTLTAQAPIARKPDRRPTTLRVTRILGDHLSEARIVESDPNHPVQLGDCIQSDRQPASTEQNPYAKAEPNEPEYYPVPINVSGRALDETGKAIAGATIYLASRLTDGDLLAETETDRNGAYQFEKVALPVRRAETDQDSDIGLFEVFGAADGHGFAWLPRKTFFPDGEQKRNSNKSYGRTDVIELNLLFGPEARLRGRVVDVRGNPIAGTVLEISHCDRNWNHGDFTQFRSYLDFMSLVERAPIPPRIQTCHVDAQGRFEFAGLPADCRFLIEVQPPGQPPRKIWAVTHEGIKADAKGNRVYSGDFDFVFTQPRKVKLRVVYGDTGAPAARVRVGGKANFVHFSDWTDERGFVEVLLTDGRYRLSIGPRQQTNYLRTNAEVVVSAKTAEKATTLKLRPAAVLDITVRDAETGTRLPGVDLWVGQEIQDDPHGRKFHKTAYGHHSYNFETRGSYYETPRSNAEGKVRALLAPGRHRIGIGREANPVGYEPVEPEGRLIECQSGEPTAIEFRMRKITETTSQN